MTKIAEVIEAGSTRFVAQCYRLNEPPRLGALVKTAAGGVETYGVVAGAETKSIEPGRRPVARGEHEPSEEAVLAANPQLAKLLITEFTAIVCGHRQDKTVRHYLPPWPARIHGFVYLCEAEEMRAFAGSLDFLDVLAGAERDFAIDEVIPACLRVLAVSTPDPQDFLMRAGKHLALLLGDQYQRLHSILKRLRL